MIEYPFPNDPCSTGYCVFPARLEDDELVFFHATPAENFEAIVQQGFRIPDPAAKIGLASVSFAKRSREALTHAVIKRGAQQRSFVIFAVRYNTLNRPGLKLNEIDIHDYTLVPPPELIGYCRIPETYVHK